MGKQLAGAKSVSGILSPTIVLRVHEADFPLQPIRGVRVHSHFRMVTERTRLISNALHCCLPFPTYYDKRRNLEPPGFLCGRIGRRIPSPTRGASRYQRAEAVPRDFDRVFWRREP